MRGSRVVAGGSSHRTVAAIVVALGAAVGLVNVYTPYFSETARERSRRTSPGAAPAEAAPEAPPVPAGPPKGGSYWKHITNARDRAT